MREEAHLARRDRYRRSVSYRRAQLDRKSTRLNSSHQIISYAVFCLKKKNTQTLNINHINTYSLVRAKEAAPAGSLLGQRGRLLSMAISQLETRGTVIHYYTPATSHD